MHLDQDLLGFAPGFLSLFVDEGDRNRTAVDGARCRKILGRLAQTGVLSGEYITFPVVGGKTHFQNQV
jgi:hypothetical protein